jgi:hypothetical protein
MTFLLLGTTPALPLHTAGSYVAAAYIVFMAIVVAYVAIMARRLRTVERELRDLSVAGERAPEPPEQPTP